VEAFAHSILPGSRFKLRFGVRLLDFGSATQNLVIGMAIQLKKNEKARRKQMSLVDGS
jgi:hypothetical protein